ncbi:MAG TPA: hypothetical protein VGO43_10970 [Pyrinomonadaceae bacterium]|nr:hypothetical protein [Pyrinomonadaceae bacterium]
MSTASNLNRIKDSFLLHFAVLFVAVVAFVGKKPPFENEYIYLLRLVRTFNPDFLLNDASFAVPASEHWVFNHLFGLFTYFFSIEVISWGGRIFCWSVLLYAVMRLARRWEIPLWMATASIFLWLCQGQSVVAKEWIFGTFEAKCVAYIFLLFALEGFARDKVVYPAVLLGLTFSFHPAVGMWGILATGLALLFCRWELPKLLKIGALTAVFALPGLIPLLSEVTRTASLDDWKFIELARFPQLFDPFSWSRNSICLVYLQLGFCLLFYYTGAGANRRKFLPAFLTSLGLFFTAGLVLRGFEQYELLRFMPMRLFPVFVPLFFLLTFAEAYRRGLFSAAMKPVAAIGLLCLLMWQSPLTSGIEQVRETYRSWNAEMSDTAKSFAWVGENTPNGTVVIAPPWRPDFWYLSHRAQVASAVFPTYVDLGEWRERVETLSGESVENKTDRQNDQRPKFYHALTTEQISKIAEGRNAKYLVTESDYPYRIVFVSGKSKVYALDQPHQ